MHPQDKDTGHSFEAYFKRATSPMVVLALLRAKPMYVYEIQQALKEKSGGVYTMQVLYPVIYKLEEQGHVEVASQIIENNRVRNYYQLTESGWRHLATLQEEYKSLSAAIGKLFDSDTMKQQKNDDANSTGGPA